MNKTPPISPLSPCTLQDYTVLYRYSPNKIKYFMDINVKYHKARSLKTFICKKRAPKSYRNGNFTTHAPSRRRASTSHAKDRESKKKIKKTHIF
jgi:hypothetical protein